MIEDPDPSDHPTRYSVRISEYARREIDQILSQIGDMPENRDVAVAWYQGFRALLLGLTENPRRFAVQEPESQKLGGEVRRDIYRYGTGRRSAAYSVFYRVRDETEDGPRVTILHIRHTSRKPITREEAKDIRAGQ